MAAMAGFRIGGGLSQGMVELRSVTYRETAACQWRSRTPAPDDLLRLHGCEQRLIHQLHPVLLAHVQLARDLAPLSVMISLPMALVTPRSADRAAAALSGASHQHLGDDGEEARGARKLSRLLALLGGKCIRPCDRWSWSRCGTQRAEHQMPGTQLSSPSRWSPHRAYSPARMRRGRRSPSPRGRPRGGRRSAGALAELALDDLGRFAAHGRTRSDPSRLMMLSGRVELRNRSSRRASWAPAGAAVEPVTRIMPWVIIAELATIGGGPSWIDVGTLVGIERTRRRYRFPCGDIDVEAAAFRRHIGETPRSSPSRSTLIWRGSKPPRRSPRTRLAQVAELDRDEVAEHAQHRGTPTAKCRSEQPCATPSLRNARFLP